jgi:Rrf2 family protein
MFELALNYGQGPVMMSDVARRQDLSRTYLHALLTALKAAGLVRSVRGAGGGFALARPPGQIKLSEILDVLEGPLSLVECVAHKQSCHRANDCAARRVWHRLASALDEVLDNVTLEDLVTPESSSSSRATTKRGGQVPRTSDVNQKAAGATPRSRRARPRKK